MAKIVFMLFMCFILSFQTCFADDSWNDFSGLDRVWDGQKSITNKEFEDVMSVLEQNKAKKEEKLNKKKIKKISGGGTSLHKDLSPDAEIRNLAPLKNDEDGNILNIPVKIIIDEVPLDKGFYKVIAQKDKNNDIYFMFYQSQFFKGKVRACETNEDYDEDELNFVKLTPYNNHFVKVIYGCLDFNAYAYIRFIE